MSEDFYLTPHFKMSELTFSSHKDLLQLNRAQASADIGKMYMLAGFAERVREIVGKPLIITSGYRCVKLNNAVKGAANSQHLYAEAIDFKAKGMTPYDIAAKIMCSDLKFEQLIVEYSGQSSWTHVSIGSKKQVLRYKDGVYTKMGEVLS